MSLPERVKNLPRRFKQLSCLEAFLQMLLIWVSKLSLKSIVIPNSLTSSSKTIGVSFNFKEVIVSWDFLPIAIPWNFSGLACI